MARMMGLSDDDAQREVERIAAILDEAAGDDAFESKVDEYARRAFEEGKLGEAAKKAAPPPGEANRRIGQLLLDRRVAGILKARLEREK
jgi:hypothetical protein